eukprot:3899782-Amphidinium_carterae.1
MAAADDWPYAGSSSVPGVGNVVFRVRVITSPASLRTCVHRCDGWQVQHNTVMKMMMTMMVMMMMTTKLKIIFTKNINS